MLNMSTVASRLRPRRPADESIFQTSNHKHLERAVSSKIYCGKINYQFPDDLVQRQLELWIISLNGEISHPSLIPSMRLLLREYIPQINWGSKDYWDYKNLKFAGHGWKCFQLNADGTENFRFPTSWLEAWAREHNESPPDPKNYQVDGDYGKNIGYGEGISRLVLKSFAAMPEGFKKHPVVLAARANYFPAFEEKSF